MSRVATAIVASATVLNLAVLGLIFWLFRQIRIGPWANLWYRDPLVGTELALSMQLETLQALLIVIGLGLTGLGLFGFKSIQDGAERAAVEAAERAAVEAAERAAEKAATEAAEKAATEVAERVEETAKGVAAEAAVEAATEAVERVVTETAAAIADTFLGPDDLDDEDWPDPIDPAGE